MRKYRLLFLAFPLMLLFLFADLRTTWANWEKSTSTQMPHLLPVARPQVQATPITPTLSLIGPNTPQPVTSTISVEVFISDAINLAGFEFDLEFDRTLLEVSAIELTGALGNPDTGCDSSVARCVASLGPMSQLTGAGVGAYSLGSGAGLTGQATVATIIFQPVGASGTTTVNVRNAFVADVAGNLTVPNTQGTTLSVVRREPTASFLPAKGLNALRLEDGATIAAFSSVYSASSSYRPENAIDRFTNTYWLTANGQPNNQWIKVQPFGGQPFVIDRVTLQGTSGSFGLRDFEIRVSTTTLDDAAFQTIFAGTVPADNTAHNFTFPPVLARYVQLYIVNNWGGNYTYVYNFQAWTRDREDGIVSLREGPPGSVADFSSRFSTSTTYDPRNAIDENPNTYWRTANLQTTNQWLKVGLGGGQIYTVDRIRLQSYTIGTAVRDFEVRVSTTSFDDAAFTTVYSGTASQNNTLQEFSFPAVEARYVQLYILNSYSTSYIQLATFQVLSPDGANMARLEGVGAFIMGYSSQSSTTFPPERAIDFSTSTYWNTISGANTNQWFKVRLLSGKSHLLDRILIQGSSGTSSPRDFQIRVSNASLADNDFVTVYDGTLPNDGQPHWLLFRPVQAKYIQLYILNNYGASNISVYDFKAFSPSMGGLVLPLDDFSSDYDGQIVSWDWDFGDGTTASERHPQHTYATPGTYQVSLTVTDNDGYSNNAVFTYNALQPPVAAFNFSPLTPNEGQTVSLTDVSTSDAGPLVGWLWQFSHTTTTSASQNTTVSFPDNGTFTVTLTVIDNQLLTASVDRSITTLNLPPAVNAGTDRTVVIGQDWAINATVSDPGIADRATLICQWDFGNGQAMTVTSCGSANPVRVPHTYTEAGTYIATLTVTDKDGATSSDSVTVTVVNRSSQVIIYGARSISASTAELQAGLYDVLNWDNVMAGRNITFSWNNQTISAVTDANGVATAVASLSVGSEITLTATFAGDVTYYGASDTNVIRVAPNLPQGDIVFIIDESGSMGDDQAEVRARLNNIITQLGYAVDLRLGLVGFGAGFGTPYAGAPRIVSPLTDDVTAFSTALGSLVTSGGFEPGFAATIMAMSDSLGFRDGAGVCAIMITDEDADRSTTYANETREDAIAALNDRNATFLGIVDPNFGTTANDYGPNPGSLADATGGDVFSIVSFRSNPGPVLAAIIDRCAQAIAQRVPPDLEVSKTSNQPAVLAGDLLTYTITITNTSIQDAAGVLLTDTLPSQTTFVSANLGGNHTNGVVTWPPFSIPFGTVVTRSVTVQVSGVWPAGETSITNYVEVIDDGANGLDPTPANNTASLTTLVEAAPDLTIAKDDGGIEVMANDSIPYLLTFSNVGTQEAAGVIITETVPQYATFNASLSSLGWSCADGSASGTICEYTASNLPVGTSQIITFTVTVINSLPRNMTEIVNTALIADDGANGIDLNPANNVASDQTPVIVPITECDLYPIALHQNSLNGIQVGQIINIYNGANPGNFGWLSWTGDNSVVSLVNSLTPPGNSDTYINPYDPTDFTVSPGDWVQGRPGVANASAVRNALDTLIGVEILVPVWVAVDNGGANTLYQVVSFAKVEMVSYKLPGQNLISARFLGYGNCGDLGMLSTDYLSIDSVTTKALSKED